MCGSINCRDIKTRRCHGCGKWDAILGAVKNLWKRVICWGVEPGRREAEQKEFETILNRVRFRVRMDRVVVIQQPIRRMDRVVAIQQPIRRMDRVVVIQQPIKTKDRVVVIQQHQSKSLA